jgi:hypothetical protein
MNCNEAAEFVSALLDGERIPRDAAEHIGACEICRESLQDYTFAAAELRRAAILNSTGDVKPMEWSKQSQVHTRWWHKGAEVMRIPKFAFVAMLVVILALGSSLVIVRARANTSGPVVLVTMKLPGVEKPFRCALFTNGNPRGVECSFIGNANGGSLGASVRFIRKDAERIRLGIRTHFFSDLTVRFSTDSLKAYRETEYDLEPGEKLRIDVDSIGQAEITGEVLGYMPVFASSQGPRETLDPAENELRVVSPIILRDREILIDMEGASSTGAPNGAVFIYSPRIGRFIFSAQRFEGALRGEVKLNRVHFDVNSQHYELLAGAPITRAEEMWVQFDPSYKPGSGEEHGAMGWSTLAHVLGKE